MCNNNNNKTTKDVGRVRECNALNRNVMQCGSVCVGRGLNNGSNVGLNEWYPVAYEPERGYVECGDNNVCSTLNNR